MSVYTALSDVAKDAASEDFVRSIRGSVTEKRGTMYKVKLQSGVTLQEVPGPANIPVGSTVILSEVGRTSKRYSILSFSSKNASVTKVVRV